MYITYYSVQNKQMKQRCASHKKKWFANKLNVRSFSGRCLLSAVCPMPFPTIELKLQSCLQIVKCICQNCKMYLSKLQNIFVVQIAKCISPNWKMYLSACCRLSDALSNGRAKLQHKSAHYLHQCNGTHGMLEYQIASRWTKNTRHLAGCWRIKTSHSKSIFNP